MRHSYAVMVSLFVAPTLAVAQMSPRDRNAAKATAESPPATALPAWLSVGGQLRARAEAYHNGGFRPDNSDQYVLTRALLNARVRPTRNTSLFVEGMDARKATELVVKLDGWTKRFVALVKDVGM